MAGEGEEEVRNRFDGEVHGSLVQAGKIGEVRISLPPLTVEKPIPRGLPRAPLRMINRERELAQLDELLEEADAAPGPVVAVLSGMRGVGKSAMGSHWANRVRKRFGGGDLSVDLAKLRREGGVGVSEILADWIRDLEAPGFAVPQTLADRAKVFERLTASRRLLVLVDDVASAAEVKPLLPTGAGSVVIVTSNFHLEELIYDGAASIAIDPLDTVAARALLEKMCGKERIVREPEQTELLISICSGLPIALCVCGARLARRRTRDVAWLVSEIGDEALRLGGLTGEGGSVQAVFDSAYADLEAAEARVYRRLGLHPGRDLSVASVVALTEMSGAEVVPVLDRLEDAHLVERGRDDFYRQHDLLRIHARERAGSEESEVQCEAAVRRLVDWYYAALRLADRALIAERLRLAEEEELAVSDLPEFDARASVFAWFDGERANVMAVFRAAVVREWDDRIWQMAEALWLMVFNRQLYADWIETTVAGVESARRGGNASAEARLLALLGRAHHDLGELDRAEPELRTALATAESAGDEFVGASVHEFLGTLLMSRGDYAGAIDEFGAARDYFVRIGRKRGAALQDYHLGAALTRNGDPKRALQPLRRAVATMQEIDDEMNVGRALMYLGQAEFACGERDRARATLAASLAITAPLGIRHVEAQSYEALAAIADAEKRPEDAVELRRRAYEVYRQIGHPRAEELAGGVDATPT